MTNTVVISVTDVNEASPVFAAGDTDSQNVAEVTTVATYSATDAEHCYSDILDNRGYGQRPLQHQLCHRRTDILVCA